MAEWLAIEREGVRLGCLDFGGTGSSVLLLHGLAGHADEWSETAGWLSEASHVVALDARGHGHSERRPSDVSPAACVADVVFAIERLDLAPAVLIGQSLGGATAILAAATRPKLVRGLVVAEASAEADTDEVVATVGEWIASWPVPFPSPGAAKRFFAGSPLAAAAWTAGLERREDGWWPSFEPEVMLDTLRAHVGQPLWEEWKRISCPTLVVRPEHGIIPGRDARAMVDAASHATLAEIEVSGHDLHLDRPREWRRILEDFLAVVELGPGGAQAEAGAQRVAGDIGGPG